jgi:hypothetical protein
MEDLTILETQDREAGAREPRITRTVAERRRKVWSAVSFNDEPGLLAEEVDDEGPERLLPAKLRALEPATAQPPPELSLRGSLRAA